MNDKVSHSRQWLAKAESDLTAARRLLDVGGPFDAACFHAQQAAEKGLKAVLAGLDAPICPHAQSRRLAGVVRRFDGAGRGH